MLLDCGPGVLPRLQALFVTRGADVLSARNTALLLIVRFMQRQAYMLAIRDAFFLTIAIAVLALVATIFVKERQRASVPEQSGEETLGEEVEQRAPAEPVLVG